MAPAVGAGDLAPSALAARVLGRPAEAVPPPVDREAFLEDVERAERLAEGAELLGEDRGLLREWCAFFAALQPPLRRMTSPNRGLFDAQPLEVRSVAVRAHCGSEQAAQAFAEAAPMLQALDGHLEASPGPFLLGARLTLADIAGLAALTDALRLALPGGVRERYGAVLRWFGAVLDSEGLAFLGGSEGVELCAWPVEEAAFWAVEAKPRGGAVVSVPGSRAVSGPQAAEPRAADPWSASDPWLASRAPPSRPPPRTDAAAPMHSRAPPRAAEGAWSGFRETRGTGRNSESFDPESTLVRPAMRILSPVLGARYDRPLRHDDVAVIPEFGCKVGDWSTYKLLVEEMKALQAQGMDGSEWVSWHNGCHSITKRPEGSATFQAVIDKICTYYDFDRESISTRFNWYRDGSDWKPFHHDSAAFNPRRAEKQNLTVGISFGRERELAFLHVEGRTLLYFPQANGTLFSFGRDVNIRWKHGVNALPAEERGGEGRISIIVWGYTRLAVEEPGSPPMLSEFPASADPPRPPLAAQDPWARAAAPDPWAQGTRPAPAAQDPWAQGTRPATPAAQDPWAQAAANAQPPLAAPARDPWSKGVAQEPARGAAPTLAAPAWSKAVADPWSQGAAHGRPAPAQEPQPSAWRAAWAALRSAFGLAALSHAHHELGVVPRLEMVDGRGVRTPLDDSAEARPAAWQGRAPTDKGKAGSGPEDSWAGYKRPSASPSSDTSPEPRGKGGGKGWGAWSGRGDAATSGASPDSSPTPGFFEEYSGCSREEFISRKIDRGCAEAVRMMRLSDNELYRLGQKHFTEQVEHVQRLQRDDPNLSGMQPIVGSFRGGLLRGRDRRDLLDEDEFDEVPYWWRGQVEALCFDLPMTYEADLTADAPPAGQWWDVQKIAESDNYVAVVKPAGMFVVTDQRGLWEESPTNFIHVAHRRFDMPSAGEPRQRGICHRLDSHTSGIQIFGKTWDAFRRFTIQNSAHKMQKEYVALVIGKMGGDEGPYSGLVDVPMKKWQDFNRREFGSMVCAHDGQPAITKYRVLRHLKVPAKGQLKFWGKDRWFSLVHLRIMTGRTHQIRVHMAFLGHPLVGDIKYNPKYTEEDAAIVPRIFLHCVRMEFEDMDHTMFVANSELVLDLQVALSRLICLAEAQRELEAANPEAPASEEDAPAVSKGAAGRVFDVPAASLGFPGLVELIRRCPGPPQESPELTGAPGEGHATAAPEGGGSALERRMVTRCFHCRRVEVTSCAAVRRGRRIALSWRLERGTEAETAISSSSAKAAGWGPGMLWVPTELQHHMADEQREEMQALDDLPDAGAEELGEHWAPHGAEWAWAHDGLRQNGWVHLRAGGVATSKWGGGRWSLLRCGSTSLLLLIFNEVEHALRLDATGPPGFAIVAKRRLALGEGSLADAPLENLETRDACCATRGWPAPGSSPRRGRPS